MAWGCDEGLALWKHRADIQQRPARVQIVKSLIGKLVGGGGGGVGRVGNTAVLIIKNGIFLSPYFL